MQTIATIAQTIATMVQTIAACAALFASHVAALAGNVAIFAAIAETSAAIVRALVTLRDLRFNNVPISQVSTALNLQPLRVERSRNPKPLVLYFDASPLQQNSGVINQLGFLPQPNPQQEVRLL